MRSTATLQLVCDRCEEPVDDCVGWEDDEHDPRLIDAFATHHPPLNLAELDTISEFTDEGRVIQVIDHGIRTLHSHFDNGTGDVYNVPAGIDYIEDMPALPARPDRTRWPEHRSSRVLARWGR